MFRRAVFLDRDGVLNEPMVRDGRAYAPVTLADLRLVDGAGDQVGRLCRAGLVPIVFTNQPEVARGLLPLEVLAQMNGRLRAEVPVVDIFVCPHDAAEGCGCHKPKAGMLHAAAEKWNLDLGKSYVVGDRWRDIDAGRAAGCYTILIERPYSQCTNADARVATLAAAVDHILAAVRPPEARTSGPGEGQEWIS
jgi:D-glycero-D-manno-heptose 1,7-bisphosphate phosphatase